MEFLEGLFKNKFGINIATLNEIPFNRQSWIYSFNNLVVSSMHLFPFEP